MSWRDYKTCSKCNTTKHKEIFNKGKHYKDGYRNQCKACIKSYSEDISEKRSEYTKNYYRENKTSRREYHKEYHRINRYKNNVSNSRRRAAKLNATVPWANKELIKQFYEATQILKEITGITYEVDHIIPLQGKNVCGLHLESNLQLLEQSENRSKSNKLIV